MKRLAMLLSASLVMAAAQRTPAQDSFGGSRPAPPPATQQRPADTTQKEPSNAAAPSSPLHAGPMHGQTPASIPGGQLITTQALSALLQERQSAFLLFDVLGAAETLPSARPAAWMSEPGSYADAVQQRVVQALQQLTQGRRNLTLVFYCASEQCWMSYNAALRAINAGYTNVRWYRGGLEAWKAARLPVQPAQGGY